ncbi:MAG: prepilin-type N-terminal cleavage/methylation domain-containing protein [Planctomycetota bacterium]|jgi:general secretion pathway protein G
MYRAKAFTLVEILIVVVLLGVLAAIVIPAFANGSNRAREAALVTDVKLLRRFVLVYTCHHLEVPPGYPNGDTTAAPTSAAFRDQAMLSSNAQGQTAPRGTAGFKYGPYLSKIPANPFNKLDTIQVLGDGEDFPAAADDSHGWICKPATREVRPDNIGADDRGMAYYDY